MMCCLEEMVSADERYDAMLPAWIIERIQEQEREKRKDDRPRPQLPLYPPEPIPHEGHYGEEDEGNKRGVVEIKYDI